MMLISKRNMDNVMKTRYLSEQFADTCSEVVKYVPIKITKETVI